MDSLSRRYYEHQLGAGMGPEMSFEKMYGYTEPVRRLIQREDFEPQANEIPNTMPNWLHQGSPSLVTTKTSRARAASHRVHTCDPLES